MAGVISCLTVFLFVAVVSPTVLNRDTHDAVDPSKQKWGYVTVRPKAHMFWWLYRNTQQENPDTPLVLWLQGGPGGSSCGFGNFGEIGPLDVNLKPRPTTWLSKAHLLFIDNPVGAGYSYAETSEAFTTDVQQIADDLLVVISQFLTQLPEFKRVPFYIFSESYGGKMTAAFSKTLHEAIVSGKVDCNFKGFAMGDSWISPIDSVLTWGPYLYSTSIVAEKGLSAINKSAIACQLALERGEYAEATALWGETQTTVEEYSNGVNFYNIMHWGRPDNRLKFKPKADIFDSIYEVNVGYMANDALSQLMNGPIKEQLKIIPKNVTWGGQSNEVFSKQRVDFMKPVIGIVDDLLTNTNLSVVIYNGQLDLIVDTLGQERWVQKLTWPGLKGYNNSRRKPLISHTSKTTAAFLQQYKHLSFYWILNAGHMIPADQGETALQMLSMVLDGQ